MSIVGLLDVLLYNRYIPAACTSHHVQSEQAHSLLLHALPPDRLSFELSQIKVPLLENLQDAVFCVIWLCQCHLHKSVHVTG